MNPYSMPESLSDRWRWVAPLLVPAVIWLLPHAGFPPHSWGLLCLFAAAVSALITRPLPAGSMIVIVISLGMLLRLFSVQDALAGFRSEERRVGKECRSRWS